jgi:RNA polymerase sigma-70 factor (ECF subfamily)
MWFVFAEYANTDMCTFHLGPVKMQSGMNNASNEDLIILYKNGDAEASRILTFRLTPKLYSLAFRILGNSTEAEDVTQEALMKLWIRAETWERKGAKITTWLYVVVNNLCTDRLRKRPPVSLDAISEPVSDEPSAEEILQSKDRERELILALQSVPDRQRMAIVLRHIEGLPNPEIASILGISTTAVESLVARGMRNLKITLDGKKSELGFGDA